MSGSGGFSVTISAVDRASKQIDSINRRIASIQAPVERVTRSIAKFSDTTGITALSRGMRSVAQQSLQAFENTTRLAAPLGAITGAASIAGMARLTSEWADFGSKLGFAATRAGTTVGQLSALQGAARLAGSSAQSLSSGMTALNDNLNNTAAGRASQETIAAFSFLKIDPRDEITHRVRSATSVLPELADKLAAVKNITVRTQLGTAILGGAYEDLAPMIAGGSAALAENAARATKLGAITNEQAEAANRLRKSETALGEAVEGLGNKISTKLEPYLTPMLNDMATWIADNPKASASIGLVGGAAVGLIGTLATLRVAWGLLGAARVAALGATAAEAVGVAAGAAPAVAGGAAEGAAAGLGGVAATVAAPLVAPLALSGDTAQNPEAQTALAAQVARETAAYRAAHGGQLPVGTTLPPTTTLPFATTRVPNGIPPTGPMFGPQAPAAAPAGLPPSPAQNAPTPPRAPPSAAPAAGPPPAAAPPAVAGTVAPAGLAATPFGALIARGESGAGGYNSVNRGEAGGYRDWTENLGQKTVGQVMADQALGKYNAAGKYQIIGPTLTSAVQALNIPSDAKFDQALQDRIFSQYLATQKRPVLGAYLSGQSNDLVGAERDASREWASVTDPDTGRSHYSGVGNNSASITTDELATALKASRAQMMALNVPSPPPPPASTAAGIASQIAFGISNAIIPRAEAATQPYAPAPAIGAPRAVAGTSPPATGIAQPSPGIANGTGAAPTPAEAKITGGASLNISLDGFPAGTRTTSSTDGNAFLGAPKVNTALPFGQLGGP